MRGWEKMNEEHIRFENWEAGDPLDQEHLAQCQECQEMVEGLGFLKQAALSAPDTEVPPFFASRVAHLAVSAGTSFWELLDRMAKRMVPLFASLVLVASFFLFSGRQEAPVEDTSIVWLAESESVRVPDTLDDMVLLLAQAEWEGDDDAEQH